VEDRQDILELDFRENVQVAKVHRVGGLAPHPGESAHGGLPEVAPTDEDRLGRMLAVPLFAFMVELQTKRKRKGFEL
jgi:hypothetical protein